MNRTDRLYGLVEELRAAGGRGRTARQLAAHFEVSVRTIERDLSALGQAGVPLATRQGRGGGYTLDRSMTLPPLNFTPPDAAAVALSLSENVLFARDAYSALRKIAAAMPERAFQQARTTAEKRPGASARWAVCAAPAVRCPATRCSTSVIDSAPGRKRFGGGGTNGDPFSQLPPGAQSVTVDVQPAPNQSTFHLHRPCFGGRKETLGTRGIDSHHQAALAARRHRYLAADQEGESAEHPLFGHR